MQPYERYALVALLFLIVLVAVVALWDDGSSEVQAAPAGTVALVDETGRMLPDGAGAARVRGGRDALAMPISGQDDLGGHVTRASTRRPATTHGVEPIRPGVGDELGAGGIARAQSAEQLRDLPKVVSIHGGSREKLALQETSAFTSRRQRGPELEATERSPVRGGSERITPPPTVRVEPAPTRPAVDAPRVASSRPYVVKSGDALRRIAKRELGDEDRWVEIASLNGLPDPDKIFEDMVLQIPIDRTNASTEPKGSARLVSDGAAARPVAPSAATPSAATPSAATLLAGQRRITIAPGESLSTRLEKELGTYARSIDLVIALNPGLNPDRVRAGQEIVLPAASAIPPSRSGARKPAVRPEPRRGVEPGSELQGTRVASAPANSEYVVR